MIINNFQELKQHVGHELECVEYGDNSNVAVECLTCDSVLIDYNNEED